MFTIASPARVRRLQPLGVALGEGVHGLAEDVQLELAGGAVADPDRARAAPALPVVKGLLGEVGGPVHPVHDAQRAAAVASAVLDQPVPDPDAEGRRLFQVAQSQQRVHRERRVPDPGVAVVPVALAPDLLREPGGRRGDQRPGRRVRHQLERHRRAGHHFPPAPGVGGLAEPGPPELGGLVRTAAPARRPAAGAGGRPWTPGRSPRSRPPSACGGSAGRCRAVRSRRRTRAGWYRGPDRVQGQFQVVGAGRSPLPR